MILARFWDWRGWWFPLLFVLGACRGGPKPEEVVARVGETQITAGEVTKELNRRRDIFRPEKSQSSALALNVKKSILGELIDRKLLLKEAAQQGIQVEPEELALELRKYKSNYTELSFQKMLADKGFTPEEWADLKKENLLIQKYLQSAMGNAEISQEEMQKYYQEHPGEFEIPESVHVRQIVTNTKDKAEAILRRLTQGENFAKLASDLSLSPDREMGGDLGFIRRGTFPREFEICFSMRPGEISPIIPSLYGFHIFKILEKAPPRILEFAEVEVRIRDILQGRRREEFVRKQIESLRAKVVVEINERVLERVEI